MIAIKHGLFSQLKAAKRLCSMGANKFTRRCERYGVGKPNNDDRPCGERAVILDTEFVADLIRGIPDDDAKQDDSAENTIPMRSWQDDERAAIR